jgi:SOUL heme-binding protein
LTERQKFQVLEKYSGFELRQYEPCVIAEVSSLDTYQEAGQNAFRSLFSYISKGNSNEEKISMTAPVIALTEHGLDSQAWKISFVMPAGSLIQNLPIPTNGRVVLRDLPAEKCVALSFKGRASLELVKKKEAELRALAAENGLLLKAETRVCRFDPPFKPGFLHYNEIVIPTE